MELTSRQAIQHLLKEYNVTVTKSSGQHFLVESRVVEDMINAAQIAASDTVLEIGAGFGTLTVKLVEKAEKVITVELDPHMRVALKKLVTQHTNLQLLSGDILGRLPDVYKEVRDLDYLLVANLPYNITSRVLRVFLETPPRPRAITVLVQREVAERVAAGPGHMSMISLSAQFYGEPKVLRMVQSSDFWPEPKVESAILQIKNIGRDAHGYQKSLGETPIKEFFRVARIGFSARRKQIHNTLAAGLNISPTIAKTMLNEANIKTTIRPQELSVAQWIRLTQTVVQLSKENV